jgi:hypothetical protein
LANFCVVTQRWWHSRDIRASSTGVGRWRKSLRYSWPGGYTEVGEGEAYAATRREALQSEQSRASGEASWIYPVLTDTFMM